MTIINRRIRRCLHANKARTRFAFLFFTIEKGNFKAWIVENHFSWIHRYAYERLGLWIDCLFVSTTYFKNTFSVHEKLYIIDIL